MMATAHWKTTATRVFILAFAGMMLLSLFAVHAHLAHHADETQACAVCLAHLLVAVTTSGAILTLHKRRVPRGRVTAISLPRPVPPPPFGARAPPCR